MKFFKRLLAFMTLAVIVGGNLLAQGTTGQLTGTVLTEGSGLPGATVTATSPNLQGARVAYTDVNGNYTLGALPPGDYTVRFEMESMQTVTREVKVGVGQTSRADVTLGLSTLAESMTIIGAAPAVLETTQVQTNLSGAEIEALPIGRTLLATTSLAPGVNTNGPGNNLTISGSYAYDNLYLVNGVAIVENLRGQPHNLFIEDAIQETTIFTAGAISAEFGRFGGGVVSAITKSGGNDFSGTLRDSLTNDAWTETSDFRNPSTGAAQPDPRDKVNSVYEGTLGGRIVRDRLWFFAAGRKNDTSNEGFFALSGLPFDVGASSFRKEAKLTGQITASHSLIGSYLDASVKGTNNCQPLSGTGCLDMTAIDPEVENPNTFYTAQYNGILSPRLLVEASYAKKEFQFLGFGGASSDRILGTPIRDFGPTGGDYFYNAPQFSELNPESRDSEQAGVKGTFYLGTKSLGTHNLTAGYDGWKESTESNNFQSASNFQVATFAFAPEQDATGRVIRTTISAGDAILYWPIFESSLGSDAKTSAFYVNDKWDLSSHFSFNLGARYDKLDIVDQAGQKQADDSEISPRLGVIYDAFGDGRIRANASYSRYVSRLSENIFGSASTAGSPALFYYNYNGPDIVGSPQDALRQLFAWFDANGGYPGLTDPEILTFIRIPGATTEIGDNLRSPSVDEWTLGLGSQIGRRAFLRADYINRNWNNFYTTQRDRETGTVVANTATGQLADKGVIYNSELYDRNYDAVQLQGQYRISERLNLAGNYTWSELKGNITGETAGSGPIADTAYTYPEYQGFAQRNPIGFLGADQTHRLRAWLSFDQPTPFGNFNVSVLQRFDSGTPFSEIGAIDVRRSATRLPDGVVNPGYAGAPTTVTYFFSDRGEFRWDDVTATDLALNYNLPIRDLGFFIQGELINAFNEQAQIGGDTSIVTGATTACVQNVGANAGQRCDLFNPFTATPIEGVHWRRGQNFGKAAVVGDFQLPRTYRVSVGLKF